MTTPCELCGYTGEMLPFYPKQRIVKCPVCQLIFFGEEIEPESLYAKEYFFGGEYRDYLADRKILQRNSSQRIGQLRRLKSSGRLLELGSAFGFFLELAQKHWEVRGIDIAPEGTEYAHRTLGLNVMLADFLTLSDELESYDIICMWDTVEHLPHPVRFIEKASRWLKPGGVLVMTTGDIESPLARFQKEGWRLIHPPTHLFYFSVTTLSQAVERAGLKVLGTSHVGYYRGFQAMLYGMFVLGRKPTWLYHVFTLNGRIDFPIYMNLYDIMMLTARKPPIASTAEAYAP
jgi:SAM-dependent methyltransferase